jgi:hypothetical protein
MNQDKKENKLTQSPFAQTYFHGTKADLQIGHLLKVGYNSNYGERKTQNLFS